MRLGLVAAAVAALGVAVVGGVVVVKQVAPTALSDDLSTDVHGLQAQYEPNELAGLADTVVVGVAGKPSTEAFVDNEEIPLEATTEPAYAHSDYTRVPFTVEQILAGEAPETLTVATAIHISYGGDERGVVDGSDDPGWSLEPGERYVLFIDRGESIWTGNWMPLGPQAVGLATESAVSFADGRQISLDDLRDALKVPVDLDSERSTPTP